MCSIDIQNILDIISQIANENYIYDQNSPEYIIGRQTFDYMLKLIGNYEKNLNIDVNIDNYQKMNIMHAIFFEFRKVIKMKKILVISFLKTMKMKKNLIQKQVMKNMKWKMKCQKILKVGIISILQISTRLLNI